MTCHETDLDTAKIEAGEDEKKLKMLIDKIKKHKYIGETSRSIYERSWEHLHDFDNLSTKSHLLKHAVGMHQNEEFNTLKFGIRVIKYSKTSFERQIFESVEIQENRHHFLLNSRSEFNRCAVPRLMCKLGDKNLKKYEQDVDRDMAREENQIEKIRELIKERNKKRAQRQRREPTAKRRKTDSETYVKGQEQEMHSQQRQEQEKRKPEEDSHHHEAPNAKRKVVRTSQDIRDIFSNMSRQSTSTQEQDAPAKETQEEEQQAEQCNILPGGK